MQIKNTYALTSSSNHEYVGRLYDDETAAKQAENAHSIVVAGDFVAKVETKAHMTLTMWELIVWATDIDDWE